ncbi:hypothetical protein [Halalkalicoccus tibetensis]|uniref:Sporulation protein YlmC, PRC-barrel domain family n=1 Tax=Halalkalicoccus tibetensis TaxID=175632 RepID=A0ABD5V7E0_9EURY
MSIELTDITVGTPVVDSTGLEIGIVSTVEDGSATLDRDPTIADELRSIVGFGRSEPDHLTITGDLVESAENGVIRLAVPDRHL